MADQNRIETEGDLAEDRGPAKGEAYGIAAVTASLKGLKFPADKKSLLEKVGRDRKIPWTKDQTIDLREVIENLPDDRFDSVTDLTRSIKEAVSAEA